MSGSLVPRLDQDKKNIGRKTGDLRPPLVQDQNTGRRQVAQDRAIHCPVNIDRYIGRTIFGHGCTKIRNAGRGQTGQHRSVQRPAVWATVGPRSEILAKDRPANINRYIGRQCFATVGPRSGILAKDRPANIDRYIGRPILGHCWTKIRNIGPR